jgi:hypothetical protein
MNMSDVGQCTRVGITMSDDAVERSDGYCCFSIILHAGKGSQRGGGREETHGTHAPQGKEREENLLR